MNDDIPSLISDLKLDIKDYKIIQRSRESLQPYYALYTSDGIFFLKYNREPINIYHKLFRIVFGTPGFNRQVSIYRQLNVREYSNFKYPKLIMTDGKKYILLNFIFIENEYKRKMNKDILIKSLFELQNSKLSIYNKGIKGYIGGVLLNIKLNFRFSIIIDSLIPLIKRCGFNTVYSTLKIFIKSENEQHKLANPLIMHNDFHSNNIFISVDGYIYISDFEGLAYEKKWIFTDIVTYAVNTSEFKIDTEVIKKYRDYISNYYEKDTIIYKTQIRMALIKRISRFWNFKPSDKNTQNAYRYFLMNVLLIDREYDIWYADNLC
jgi:hypothetical protein